MTTGYGWYYFNRVFTSSLGLSYDRLIHPRIIVVIVFTKCRKGYLLIENHIKP